MDLPISDSDIQQLNERDREELRGFLNNEAQKARIQGTVHSLTSVCFKKCITGNIKSGKLSGGEESCMRNCTERFFDTADLTMKFLQNMRQE
ncbi:Tim10/DDP family zinc finger protein [Xylariaceae sp. FL0804]|nr:Tim10/DDP family zinc finger protein [Xylariaceae sp. FL0804]